LALGVEQSEPDIMKRKPRAKNDGIFAGGLGFDVVYQGILSTVLTLAAYFVGHYMESGKWEIVTSPHGMTMAFLTLSMLEIFHSLNMRSQRHSIFSLKKQNMLLWGAMALTFVLTTTVIYVPFLARLFEFEAISLAEYGVSMGIAFLIIPLVELVKLVQRLVAKKKA
jgi:Ca2+-transporting ATPase